MTGRPAVYFHVEFGVSWTPGQPSKHRQATYVSSRLRNQQPAQVPRRLQHANPDFLSASAIPHQRYLQYPNTHEHRGPIDYQQQIYEFYQPNYTSRRQHIPHPRHEEQAQHHNHHAHGGRSPRHAQPGPSKERRSRSLNSRPSQERGKSAPPPLNTTLPWDAEPEPMAATLLPSRPQRADGSKQAPSHSKFRLGDDDMPWSTTFPSAFMLPIDNDNGEGPSRGAGDRGTFGAPRRTEERDRGRVTEIESLAAALMTVDNGFEDQWWNQGPRLVNIEGELKSAAALEDMLTRERGGSVDTSEELRMARARFGSIVSPSFDDAEPTMVTLPARRASLPSDSPVPSIVDIVSPVSDVSSPGPSYRMMRRTLTTRSDELHMS